jgi:CBS domain containing-hemolysin-like protein
VHIRVLRIADLVRPLSPYVALALALAGAASSAHASFLSGEALDTAADVLAIVVLCIVPIGAIVIFWLVHVLPEKIAEKRHHPQQEAITTLCLLSLVFGGMLWPVAWLWAYTKPVAYRAAYGTDKHEHYFVERGEKARSGTLLPEEIAHLRDELDEMAARGALPPELRNLRVDLDALHVRAVESAPPPVATPAPAPAPRKG